MGNILKVVLSMKERKTISSEALKDITPIEWSDDVLNGKYKDKSIINKVADGDEQNNE